jgi:beta-galactosidase
MKAFTPHKFLYGACYYHEYHQVPRLDKDFELMREGGLSVLRVGESVWSLWEPSDGEFNLEWLEPILDKAQKQGISIIIGTPTYAIPPWLASKHPELIAQRKAGQPIAYGHRQNVDYSNPLFLTYAERIIRKIVERYKEHPSIIGWQVDNEPGLELFHNSHAFTEFKEYVKAKYKTIDKLNHEWGLVYWSHQISDWNDIWLPEGNTDPTYDLDWRTFQAGLTTTYIGWQADIVRSIVPKKHFVTTCIDLGRAGSDDNEIAKRLDLTSVNVYYSPQDGLMHPQPEKIQGGTPWTARQSGPGIVYLLANIARGLKQENFLVTETNATMLGHPPNSGMFPPYPGQLQQVAVALISRGAEMVEYWHWHTIPFGHESYWGGILGHNLQPERTFESFKEISATLAKLGPKALGLTPVSEVAMLISAQSRWAMEFQPALRTEATGAPLGDKESYRKFLNTFSDLFFSSDLHVQFFSSDQLPDDPAELVRKHPIFCIPGYYIADEKVLKYAVEYARAGGHLVITPRTGYANPKGTINTDVMPGVLREALGVHYNEFSHLTLELPVHGFEQSGGTATQWVDSLIVDDAQVLATYEHPFFKTFPAVTTKEFGKGRATYIGTLPNYELSKGISQWIRSTIASHDRPTSKSAAVTTNSAINSQGKELHFIFNWGWESVKVNVPFTAKSAISDIEINSNSSLEIGPWSFEVVERN